MRNVLKSKLYHRPLMGLFLAGWFVFTACSDDSTDIYNEETIDIALKTAEDDVIALEEFSSIAEFVVDESNYIDSNEAYIMKSENLADCVNVIYDQSSRTLSIDFGTDGCIGSDGLTRTGVITARFTGRLVRPGNSATVSLRGYTVEGIAIEGQKTISNVTANPSMPSFRIQVSNASITGPAQRIRSWSSDFTITMIEGGDTSRPFDNIYQTTGASTGINRNGNNFSRTITVPLIKNRKIGCLRNYLAGEVTITNDSFEQAAVIDFGDGTCDRRATVTINGQTRMILLR